MFGLCLDAGTGNNGVRDECYIVISRDRQSDETNN